MPLVTFGLGLEALLGVGSFVESFDVELIDEPDIDITELPIDVDVDDASIDVDLDEDLDIETE